MPRRPIDVGSCSIPDEGRTAACVRPNPQGTIGGSPAPGRALRTLPQWCIDNAFDGLLALRTEVCEIVSSTLTVFRTTNGVTTVVGLMEFNIFSYAYTSTTSGSWIHQFEISPYIITGEAAGSSVQASATCVGGCNVTRSTFPSQPAPLNARPGGEAVLATTAIGSGVVDEADTSWNAFFTNPRWGSSTTFSAALTTIRCDTATPGTPTTGCVIPWYAAWLIYSLTGPYPELASHIRRAQESGLPGGISATPLTRLTNSLKIEANRLQACRDSYPRPVNKSCDEYPFASTYQGLATGGGTARTFPGCSITLAGPGSTGPTGVSVCMIVFTQNSGGGGTASAFYRQNRVLDRDPFRVVIVD